MEDKKFKYIIDSFADIKVIRFEVPEFNTLSYKEKEYIYYLSEAAKFGRDIIWAQFGKYNLIVRKTLENIFETYEGDRETKDFLKFTDYLKRVYFSNGFYHHYGKYKFFPECSKKYFEKLLDKSNNSLFPLKENQAYLEFKYWILDIIYLKEEKDGDILLDDYTDFYENITEKEARKFYEKKSNNSEPVQYGLNSKLVKENNEIKEVFYKQNGLYGKAIDKIIYYLEKAVSVSITEGQKQYTNLLIKYFKTGDLKLWDLYNISWLKNESYIDYINGFIEVYDDPLAYKGTYESLVNMKDKKSSVIAETIASNAQWFEDNSPIDTKFKKEKVEGIRAKAIHVITLSGINYPTSPIGINLPNSDWIREKHGSKSVTITNLTEAHYFSSLELPKSISKEFIYTEEELKLEEKYIFPADDIHVHLHECIGHGSGKLLPNVSFSALKELASELEEARADILGLYYMADKKLIELGIIDSLDLAKAYYSDYIRNGLQTQLTRVNLGDNIVEAHMKGKLLISALAYEKGIKDKIIEKIIKNKKTYFIVNDFLKLREIFKEILIELQRIKSEGDYETCKYLFETYGTKVGYDLHKEVLKRYKNLNLKPYTGFINPEIIPVKKRSKIIDYKIIYPTDFIKQNINYSQKYSTL